MKMALTVALHARPNPLCIDRARDDLQPVQPGEKLFALSYLQVLSTIGLDGLGPVTLYKNAT